MSENQESIYLKEILKNINEIKKIEELKEYAMNLEVVLRDTIAFLDKDTEKFLMQHYGKYSENDAIKIYGLYSLEPLSIIYGKSFTEVLEKFFNDNTIIEKLLRLVLIKLLDLVNHIQNIINETINDP